MLKKLWLRDYDLVSMKETIKEQLANGETPDDCVIKLSDLKDWIKNNQSRIEDATLFHHEGKKYTKQAFRIISVKELEHELGLIKDGETKE